MYPLLEAAAPVLEQQHSLITRRQAVRLVNAEAPVRHLLAKGIWERVDRGLYGPMGVPMTFHRRCMAAVLSGPPATVVSHRAAAALHGVGGLVDPLPEVTIPAGASYRRRDVVVHESVDLERGGVTVVDGIPATDLVRLAVDLGSVVSPARFTHTIREIRHAHHVDSGDLLRAYLRHKQRGRNGCGALRDWLDRYFAVKGTAESGAEQVVLDAVLDAGLPAPVLQLWVETDGGSFRLDLAYPGVRVAVEVDGIQHEDVEVDADDDRRTQLLEAQGWTVLRVRARHLATDLPRLLRELRPLLS